MTPDPAALIADEGYAAGLTDGERIGAQRVGDAVMAALTGPHAGLAARVMAALEQSGVTL